MADRGFRRFSSGDARVVDEQDSRSFAAPLAPNGQEANRFIAGEPTRMAPDGSGSSSLRGARNGRTAGAGSGGGALNEPLLQSASLASVGSSRGPVSSMHASENMFGDASRNSSFQNSNDFLRAGTPSPRSRRDFYKVWEKHQRRRKQGWFERLVKQFRRHWNSLRTPNPEEGLDFDLSENKLYAQKLDEINLDSGTKRAIFTFCGVQGLRWLAGWLIAMIVSVIAIVLGIAVNVLSDNKFESVREALDQHDSMLAFAKYAGTNALFVTAATALVAFLDLRAKGSGVPEIKSYLNGRKIHRVISVRTLFSKLAGVILSVSGSLVLGKEGPMMHIGAVVGAIISQGRSEVNGFGFEMLIFRSDLEKRFFVSIGCACGVAAAFSAPLGGVLFVIEEASSYWSVQLTWLTFFATMSCAAFVDVVLSGSRSGSEWGLMSQSAVVSFGSFEGASRSECYPEQAPYHFVQLPIFLLMGVAGGLAGALFNQTNLYISKFRLKHVTSPWMRSLEAILVSALTSMVFFGVTYAYPCRSRQGARYTDKHHSMYTNITCDDVRPLGNFCDNPEKEFNDVESMMMTGLDSAVKQLFHSELIFDYNALALTCVSMFVLACVTYGISIPSGLFVPAICIGSAYGRFVGQLLWEVDPHGNSFFGVVDPGTFALIGAASVLGGITRMTISIVVILIETTNNSTYAIPIMVAIMASKVVGDFFTTGLYDMHIELQGIKFVHDTPSADAHKIQARDCMNKNPVVFHIFERVGDILDILNKCSHNGFPVVSYLSMDSSVPPKSPSEGLTDNGTGPSKGNMKRRAKPRSKSSSSTNAPANLIIGIGADKHAMSHRSLDGVSGTALFTGMGSKVPTNESANPWGTTPKARILPKDPSPSTWDPSLGRTRESTISHTTIDALEDEKEAFGVFEGTILRSELLILLFEKCFLDESLPLLERIKDTEPKISWRDFNKHYPRHPSIKDVISRLEAEDLERIVDLRPYLNSSALVVHHSVYMTRVHQLFRHLGLRHLSVVNTVNQVVGVITREQVCHGQGPTMGAIEACEADNVSPVFHQAEGSCDFVTEHRDQVSSGEGQDVSSGYEQTKQLYPEKDTQMEGREQDGDEAGQISSNVEHATIGGTVTSFSALSEADSLESSTDAPLRVVNSWRRMQNKKMSGPVAQQLIDEVNRAKLAASTSGDQTPPYHSSTVPPQP